MQYYGETDVEANKNKFKTSEKNNGKTDEILVLMRWRKPLFSRLHIARIKLYFLNVPSGGKLPVYGKEVCKMYTHTLVRNILFPYFG